MQMPTLEDFGFVMPTPDKLGLSKKFMSEITYLQSVIIEREIMLDQQYPNQYEVQDTMIEKEYDDMIEKLTTIAKSMINHIPKVIVKIAPNENEVYVLAKILTLRFIKKYCVLKFLDTFFWTSLIRKLGKPAVKYY